jgi:hypothetical protein
MRRALRALCRVSRSEGLAASMSGFHHSPAASFQ